MAKDAVVRLLNAAGTFGEGPATRTVRLRLVGGSGWDETTLVVELLALLQLPAERLQVMHQQPDATWAAEGDTDEEEDDAGAAGNADPQAVLLDIKFLAATKKNPGPSSDKLVPALAEQLGQGSHTLFRKGVALPHVDRLYGLGTLDPKTGALGFEYSTHSDLARAQEEWAREEAACEELRWQFDDTSETLNRRTAEVSSARNEVERLLGVVAATQDEVGKAGRVTERARENLRGRSIRTGCVITMRLAFNAWTVEARETVRCESAWVRGQLASLENELEKEARVVEDLKGSLQLATVAAASTRAAHQAQLGRVKSREAKKNLNVESALLARIGKEGLRKVFHAWVWVHRELIQASQETIVELNMQLQAQLQASQETIQLLTQNRAQ